ncbi:hypothetical protein [Streptomyces canus]|uniref:hypothetical protein n=1 Tax=Streptomyces canus TaxID=58343 RepID=UPI0022570E26|nr:hypothetical protein [Streptomyces canus]MCX4856603.1 hypothetical protein [Streptomyces canus]
MPQIVDRRTTVSEVVDSVFRAQGYDSPSPAAETITEKILSDLIVDDEEWVRVQRENPTQLDVLWFEKTLGDYLTIAMEAIGPEQIATQSISKIWGKLKRRAGGVTDCGYPYTLPEPESE